MSVSGRHRKLRGRKGACSFSSCAPSLLLHRDSLATLLTTDHPCDLTNRLWVTQSHVVMCKGFVGFDSLLGSELTFAKYGFGLVYSLFIPFFSEGRREHHWWENKRGKGVYHVSCVMNFLRFFCYGNFSGDMSLCAKVFKKGVAFVSDFSAFFFFYRTERLSCVGRRLRVLAPKCSKRLPLTVSALYGSFSLNQTVLYSQLEPHGFAWRTQKPLHFSCLYKTARFLVATKQRSPMFFRGAYVTLQMCTSLCDLTFVCHLLTFAGSIPPSAGLKVFRGRKSYVRNTAAGDETPTVSISAEVRATVYVIGTPLPLPHGAATQMGTGRYSCRSSRLPPLAKRDKLKFYLISPALSPGGRALQ